MASFCTSCGAPLDEGLRFCTECGAARQGAPEEAPAPKPQPEPRYQQPVPQARQQSYDSRQEDREYRRANRAPNPNSPYAPITAWGFVGSMLLMSIPIVGLILAIVWACGGCRKINKRNLARAFLIMMAIGLVLGLIGGLVVRGIAKRAVEEAGLSAELMEEGLGGLGALASFGSLADDGGLGALAGLGDGISPGEEYSLGELGELAALMEDLEELTGEESGGDAISGLIENVEDINAEAEAANDGWPASLRPYPGGTAKAVASYRTEISDTSAEEMMGWINDLKGDGFAFQDFYDFGMSEEDMLAMNAWWATDGSIYLSVSCYDGLVTVDHTKELPDIESYFN